MDSELMVFLSRRLSIEVVCQVCLTVGLLCLQFSISAGDLIGRCYSKILTNRPALFGLT